MVYSLWDLAGRLVVSAAVAAQSTLTPIPQDTNYAALAAGEIAQSNLATDPTTHGKVLAAVDANVPQLQVFIINNDVCLNGSTSHSYRIIIQNVGQVAAVSIVTQDKYPDITKVTSVGDDPPGEDDAQRHILLWRQAALAPGGVLTYAFTLDGSIDQAWTNFVTVQYNDAANRGPYQVATQHILDALCPNDPSQTGPLPQNKSAAIICDPAETNCVPFTPRLGLRFQNARSPQEGIQLGPRFAEAVADIVPGECRVLNPKVPSQSDDIIVTPAYQDALNRQSNQASFFIEPLYQSGLDFKRVVQENSLLGITNTMYAQAILSAIHTKYWDNQAKALQQVMNGTASTDTVRNQIQGWRDGWVQETQAAQQDLGTRYLNMQRARQDKFDPVAAQAITNAQDALQRSCGTSSDGGLAARLPAVKQQYSASLAARTQAYAAMQKTFSDPNNPLFPQANQAQTWMSNLRVALDAFDKGNKQPLADYIASIGTQDTAGFNTAFRLTYGAQQQDDIAADEVVRLQGWEIALDTPKTAAVTCAKEKVFGPPVETTWCESGAYGQMFGPKAQQARAQNSQALPPDTSGFNTNTAINVGAVIGQACSELPGDPYWAKGCVCHCGQEMPGAFDSNGFQLCQDGNPIILHDITITSSAECMSDRANQAANEEGDPLNPGLHNVPPF